jgi:hypothetical protein
MIPPYVTANGLLDVRGTQRTGVPSSAAARAEREEG